MIEKIRLICRKLQQSRLLEIIDINSEIFQLLALSKPNFQSHQKWIKNFFIGWKVARWNLILMMGIATEAYLLRVECIGASIFTQKTFHYFLL